MICDLSKENEELKSTIANLEAKLKVVKEALYKITNDIVGALECTKQEFYRRVASDYEDAKIEQNGDLT